MRCLSVGTATLGTPSIQFFWWMLAILFAVCHGATPVARALAAAGLEVAAGFAASVMGWEQLAHGGCQNTSLAEGRSYISFFQILPD